jgi:hypothetical protein
VEILVVSRTGQDTGQGRTVKEERNCRAGQELPAKGMAHVPGGKGAGEGSAERDEERALSLVLESPVRSGFLTPRGLDRDWDRSIKVLGPPKNGPDRLGPVFCSLLTG